MTSPASTESTEAFRAARDVLLRNRTDYEAARAEFAWPRPAHFNWALDWFDRIAEGNDGLALHLVEEDGAEERVTFDEMRIRSNRVANWLRAQGVHAGDRVILMLGNQVELWETLLALMKLRAVVIPATPQLGPHELDDRVTRGGARHVIVRGGSGGTGGSGGGGAGGAGGAGGDTAKFADVAGDYTRIAVGAAGALGSGWLRYEDAYAAEAVYEPDGVTSADDTLLLYFTSGTTALPKLVEHTHVSYPVGHLATMYWIGLKPGDVHLNISSPGWAKHAWSNFFAPWNAEATIFIHNYSRFDASRLMAEMDSAGVTSFCAPPTVWRMLIQADLTRLRNVPREIVAAGEPLNPEVIEHVRRVWGATIRDGFGQTETAVQVANSPGQPLKSGSMGRPTPGFDVTLVDPVTGSAGVEEGEICLDLSARPVGLMTGYHGDPERTAAAMADGYYRTGDIGSRDAEGYLTYVGRSDDVFKASDYKISPFELESVLLEHEAVAEAAIVPSPDQVRLAVPKAYVVLAEGWAPDEATAHLLMSHCRERLAPYKRVRVVEFADLPKTISGKIRRVELRAHAAGEEGVPGTEFRA